MVEAPRWFILILLCASTGRKQGPHSKRHEPAYLNNQRQNKSLASWCLLNSCHTWLPTQNTPGRTERAMRDRHQLKFTERIKEKHKSQNCMHWNPSFHLFSSPYPAQQGIHWCTPFVSDMQPPLWGWLTGCLHLLLQYKLPTPSRINTWVLSKSGAHFSLLFSLCTAPGNGQPQHSQQSHCALISRHAYLAAMFRVANLPALPFCSWLLFWCSHNLSLRHQSTCLT